MLQLASSAPLRFASVALKSGWRGAAVSSLSSTPSSLLPLHPLHSWPPSLSMSPSQSTLMSQKRQINIGDYGPARANRSSYLRQERAKQLAEFEKLVERTEKRRQAAEKGEDTDTPGSFDDDADWTDIYQNTQEADTGGFRSQRLSDEETLALLDEAGSYIPERTGPRRSRYLKRERNRWRAVRQLDKHKKIEKKHANIRKDLGRKRRVKEVKYVLETAEQVREVEKAYRERVLRDTLKANMSAGLNE